MKVLTDIGETEAMTNAALYISSLQNEDGGFVYQQGLSSNAYLSAEIADILVDTVNVNPILSYYLGDTFTALNDRGYAVSAFNSNENVNISVLNEFENEKAYLAVSIITPDGTVISLDSENSVWNTADYADGEYTVRAEIIRTSNDGVVTSLEQTF